MTDAGNEQIPKSIGSGSIAIFGVTLEVHTLDNGQRIIEAESMARFVEAMAAYDGPETSDEDMMELARLIKG